MYQFYFAIIDSSNEECTANGRRASPSAARFSSSVRVTGLKSLINATYIKFLALLLLHSI